MQLYFDGETNLTSPIRVSISYKASLYRGSSMCQGRMSYAGYDETTLQLLVPILGNSTLELLVVTHLAQLIY